MKYTEQNKNIILTEFNSFSVAETLECGQCFRFTKLGENEYVIVAFVRILHIKQTDEEIIFYNTSIKDFEEIWLDYFDLNRDYMAIKERISKDDSVLKSAIEFAPGIRILNQEFFECLISFIISQNNRIPMIKKVIGNISERYGEFLGEINGEKYYSFPTAQRLSRVTESELMECKTGFRAKYILNAVSRYISGEIPYDTFCDIPTEKVKENLMLIKGVGTKVSDCVLLFSCRKCDAFPTDVWVKRIMSYFYFNGEDTSINVIHELAKKNYGEYSGFAQQYLFNYARIFKIGTDKK